MNSMFSGLVRASLAMSLIVNIATAYDFSKKMAVTIFKGFGKYPYALKLNQFSNEVDVILYGCLGSDGGVKLVKSARDYEALVPVQFKMGFPDNGIKIEKTYSGYNETCLTRVTDKTLKTLGLLSSEDYKHEFKEDFLVDEYKKGQVIKIVLPTLEHFNFLIKNYLLEKLESGLIDKPAQKPLFLFELESGEEIDKVDLERLSKFVEIADLNDERVLEYFAKNESKIYKTLWYYKDFYQVGQSFGELIMQSVDRDFEKGDVKKLTIRFAKIVALGLTILFLEELIKESVINPSRGWVKGLFKPKQDEEPTVPERSAS